MQKKWVSIVAGGALFFSVTSAGLASESGGAGTSGGAATSGGATSVAPAPEAAAPPPPEALPPGPPAPAPVAAVGVEPIWIIGGAVVTAGIICAIVCGGHSTTTTTH